MTDVTAKGKRIFWLMILIAFFFAAVPSLVFVEKIKEYHIFLTGSSPAVIRPTTTRHIPPPPDEHEKEMPDIHFVEFRLRAPNAKSVFLSANFNGWRADSLALTKGTDHGWKIIVPLPPGKYYYGFEVDGRWMPDEKTLPRENKNGREVSVREVP